MKKNKSPHVFLTYTHESEQHKDWVRNLAENLEKNGVKTILDQWDLHVGDDIGTFTEKAFSEVDYVILVCTELFASKAHDRQGGVGFEQAFIVGQLLTKGGRDSKFLPVLRSGEPSSSLPLYLQSRLFVDFRDDQKYDAELEQLLRRLYGAPSHEPPQRGSPPDFVPAGKVPNSISGKVAVNPSVQPPRAWALVSGTGVGRIEKKIKQTCDSLGKKLAQNGYGIVTGGWSGVDEITARSFARELEVQGMPLEDRLTQVVMDDESKLPAFPAGNLVLVQRGEEEWTESVRRADFVILIGGVGGTYTTGEFGLKFGCVVLPLADTGGDAKKFYLRMQRDWSPEYIPGVEKSRFQLIAREAPDVISGLMDLLGELTDL